MSLMLKNGVFWPRSSNQMEAGAVIGRDSREHGSSALQPFIIPANGPGRHSQFTLLGFVKVKLFAMGQLLPSVSRLKLRVVKVCLELGLRLQSELFNMNANALWPEGMEARNQYRTRFRGRENQNRTSIEAGRTKIEPGIETGNQNRTSIEAGIEAVGFLALGS